ncbi:MAG: HD domain-containing protein [Deltaproteobacteria bacterium]|nr:HD domain-containing protein [Deltaproteobacteria bacterium]
MNVAAAGKPLDTLTPGEPVGGAYLLLRAALAQSKAGKAYGTLTLGDPTGQLEAKVWDDAERLLAPLAPGQVVEVAGRTDAYQGRRQLVLTQVALHEGGLSPAAFLPASPIPLEELWGVFNAARKQVKNKHLKALLKAVFDEPDTRAAFEAAPGAKMAHHAYVHGLLEHTGAVATLALAMARSYPAVDRELLAAGALLHDLGKAYELTLGPPLDYTDEGRLEGHLALGLRLVEEKMGDLKGFPPAVALHLRHLILAHHGDYAMGSPRRPKTPEALLLHMADDTDAKMTMFREAAQSAQGDGHFSPYHRLLERVIYLGPSPWDLVEEGSDSAAAAEEAATAQASLFGLAPDREGR